MSRKHLIALMLVLLLLAGPLKVSGTDYPDSTITIDDLVYDAVLSIEASQLNLTDNPEEQVKILHASTEKLLSLIKQTKDRKKLSLLLDDYQKSDNRIWELWESLEGDEAQLVANIMLDIKEERASRLELLAENQFLPEQARQGLSRAIENQQKAMEKQEEALEKARKTRERADQAAQAAAAVPSSAVAPGQAGSTPGQSGETPGQTGSTPGQSGSEPPGQAGSTPGQSGSTPGQSGSTPGQSGSTPGQSGSAPGQSGGSPGQSGSAPGLSGGSPGQSGSAPGQSKGN